MASVFLPSGVVMRADMFSETDETTSEFACRSVDWMSDMLDFGDQLYGPDGLERITVWTPTHGYRQAELDVYMRNFENIPLSAEGHEVVLDSVLGATVLGWANRYGLSGVQFSCAALMTRLDAFGHERITRFPMKVTAINGDELAVIPRPEPGDRSLAVI